MAKHTNKKKKNVHNVKNEKGGNEIGRIPAMITETENGGAIDIETTITERYEMHMTLD